MRRASKGYTRVDIPLFPRMLVQGPNLQGQGSTVQSDSHHTTTSAPSTSQPPTSPPFMQTTNVAEEVATLPHDSPLPRVYSLGRDEGSMTLHELTVLYTTLSKEVESLESDLKKTKLTYGVAFIKLIMKGRSMIEDIDQDAGVTLVQIDAEDQRRFKDETNTQVSAYGEAHSQGSQPEDQLGVFSVAKILVDVARVHTYSRRRRTVSTVSGGISTAEESVSTAGASMPVSTTGMDQGSIPSPSASKDKAAIRLQEQLDEEESQRIVRDAKGFTDAEWDDILARVAADEDLVQRLQAIGGCQEVFEDTAKRQKIKEASGSGEEQSAEKEKELSEEELQKLMMIVPVEEVYVEALQVKYPIIDWEKFDRDDLDKLWSLVKERFSSTDPTDDK
ncbi:hypothetical protein Tco_0486735 [Tanacetum coccineum]